MSFDIFINIIVFFMWNLFFQHVYIRSGNRNRSGAYPVTFSKICQFNNLVISVHLNKYYILLKNRYLWHLLNVSFGFSISLWSTFTGHMKLWFAVNCHDEIKLFKPCKLDLFSQSLLRLHNISGGILSALDQSRLFRFRQI